MIITQLGKAKNWSGNVVHKDVAASGVTIVLEEAYRNEIVGEHELGGVMFVIQVLRSSEAEL